MSRITASTSPASASQGMPDALQDLGDLRLENRRAAPRHDGRRVHLEERIQRVHLGPVGHLGRTADVRRRREEIVLHDAGAAALRGSSPPGARAPSPDSSALLDLPPALREAERAVLAEPQRLTNLAVPEEVQLLPAPRDLRVVPARLKLLPLRARRLGGASVEVDLALEDRERQALRPRGRPGRRRAPPRDEPTRPRAWRTPRSSHARARRHRPTDPPRLPGMRPYQAPPIACWITSSIGSPRRTRASDTPWGAASSGYANSVSGVPPSPRKARRDSSKSWSSDATQKMGTTGRPVARSSSRANAIPVIVL